MSKHWKNFIPKENKEKKEIDLVDENLQASTEENPKNDAENLDAIISSNANLKSLLEEQKSLQKEMEELTSSGSETSNSENNKAFDQPITSPYQKQRAEKQWLEKKEKQLEKYKQRKNQYKDLLSKREKTSWTIDSFDTPTSEKNKDSFKVQKDTSKLSSGFSFSNQIDIKKLNTITPKKNKENKEIFAFPKAKKKKNSKKAQKQDTTPNLDSKITQNRIAADKNKIGLQTTKDKIKNLNDFVQKKKKEQPKISDAKDYISKALEKVKDKHVLKKKKKSSNLLEKSKKIEKTVKKGRKIVKKGSEILSKGTDILDKGAKSLDKLETLSKGIEIATPDRNKETIKPLPDDLTKKLDGVMKAKKKLGTITNQANDITSKANKILGKTKQKNGNLPFENKFLKKRSRKRENTDFFNTRKESESIPEKTVTAKDQIEKLMQKNNLFEKRLEEKLNNLKTNNAIQIDMSRFKMEEFSMDDFRIDQEKRKKVNLIKGIRDIKNAADLLSKSSGGKKPFSRKKLD